MLQKDVNEYKPQKQRAQKETEKRQARKRVPISHDNNGGFLDSDPDRNDKGKTKSRAALCLKWLVTLTKDGTYATRWEMITSTN